MRRIQERSLYRHFKGDFYYVEKVVRHTETGEKMVSYQALYGEKETHVRPLIMFLEEVPPGRENPTGQKYRFECMDDLGKRMLILEGIEKDSDYWKERCKREESKQ